MAFYNPFPVTYQNPYYNNFTQQPVVQPTQTVNGQQPVTQQPINNNSIIWVQGEAGAKSYLVAPNTTVQLWDSEAQVIYLKSADASGMPSIKVIDYTIRGENQPVQTLSVEENDYISRKEFDDLKSDLKTMQNEITKLKPRNKKEDKKEDKHNG